MSDSQTTDPARSERQARAEAFVRDCLVIMGQEETPLAVQEIANRVLLALPADWKGMYLSPRCLEVLMGYPPGWTALDASATPLSRKSQK